MCKLHCNVQSIKNFFSPVFIQAQSMGNFLQQQSSHQRKKRRFLLWSFVSISRVSSREIISNCSKIFMNIFGNVCSFLLSMQIVFLVHIKLFRRSFGVDSLTLVIVLLSQVIKLSSLPARKSLEPRFSILSNLILTQSLMSDQVTTFDLYSDCLPSFYQQKSQQLLFWCLRKLRQLMIYQSVQLRKKSEIQG